MSENLRKLYNTLCLIEVKGESAIIMAQCLDYVKQLIQTAKAAETTERE